MDYLYYAFFLLVTLIVLVTSHELGHFLVARWAGLHVVRFSVGFGKPVWSFYDRRGTEFCVAAVPLGGYVRMYDRRDADAAAHVPRVSAKSYDVLSPWWRIAVALAGPAANFVLAFLVFWLLSVMGVSSVVPIVGSVAAESPAEQAGLLPGDEIVAVDGVDTPAWTDIGLALASRLGDTGTIEIRAKRDDTPVIRSIGIEDWLGTVQDPDTIAALGIGRERLAVIGGIVEGEAAQRGGLRRGDRIVGIDGEPISLWTEFVGRVRTSAGRTIVVTVQRGGGETNIRMTPAQRIAEDGTEHGYAGAWLDTPTRLVRYGGIEALGRAASETYAKTVLTVELLGKMLTLDVPATNLAGPITIGKVTGDSARAGFDRFLWILALLSISLGIINLVPIPILDGGHVVYSVVEIVRSKPVSMRAQAVGAQIGLAIVVGLMLFVFYVDIARWLPG
ncbi:MAG: RIP metalloprotease RseP [Gammaproteobacteria bacterium]|nr:RIP metalloprotease RseP [Gammaproteobacteria bacterium]MXY58475.1 RIP metalloprotease RseP [Gammaproteobacteria bacterium]MYF29991.1 RIP metalloprotease RseP [Gammaproteobacteria bacterium]MYK48163.1 RIP metalloprotease RseP [Gammaproteobacteria bacterium]